MGNFSEIINKNKIVLVDFSAEWCGPCKTLAPMLKEVKNKVGNNANIIKIDIDKNPGLTNFYQIQSVPTLLLFKNGKLKWRESGVKPVHELVEIINQNI